MKKVWKISYVGPNACSGSLMGDPIVALMCNRENGRFTPYEDITSVSAIPGHKRGILTAITASGRALSAELDARIGGQWEWSEAGDQRVGGTRHFDFVAGSATIIEVLADKPFAESWFARHLQEHGWALVSEDVPEE